MTHNKILTGAAAIVAAAGLVVTGAALSNASLTTPTATSTSGTSGTASDASANPSNDTPVTGTELNNVKTAVKAKDATVTVTSVRKDPDGSYDVFGTKAGADVRLEVSADLKTITTATGRGGHGGSGGGGSHTPVTGTELDKVKAAVKAKDSAVTVTSVQKDADGSYDVFGTKAGADVRLEASADLKTISTATGRGGHGGGHSHTPVTATELANVKAAVKAKDSAVTVTEVRKDPDGSFDVIGTKAGVSVMLEVSKDLKTITTNSGGGQRN